MTIDNLEKIEINSQKELRAWLTKNFKQVDSVWLITYKKIVTEKYVSRDQVLDELISFGWIDGVRRAVDDVRTMQLISPRKTKPWAKSYKDRAERLVLSGEMHAAGLESIELAKSSGAWDEMNEVDLLVVPDDLKLVLKKHGKALDYFEAFPDSTKRNILRWINSAKTSETRVKRLLATAQEAQHNRRVASHG